MYFFAFKYTCILSLLCLVFSCSLNQDTAGGAATEAGNPELAVISGVLLDSEGNPAAYMPYIMQQDTIAQTAPVAAKFSAKVASNGIDTISDTTNAEGGYTIHNVLPGKYTLLTTPNSGEYSTLISFSFDVENSVELDSVQAAPPGTLNIHFTSDIHDVQMVTIRISAHDSIYSHFYREANADFSIDLPNGNYFIRIIVPNKNNMDHLFINNTLSLKPNEIIDWDISIDKPYNVDD
ncbi:MAG: carboxypeptidase-like regulatory domain-containing protein [Fibrobacterales bacterium]